MREKLADLLREALQRKRITIPAVIVVVAAVLMGGLYVVGQFSTVPEKDRIQVQPTATAASTDAPTPVEGADDPSREPNPAIIPLAGTTQPQELAKTTAKLLGSMDTARFKEADYVKAVTPQAASISDPSGSRSPQQVAETVVKGAWSSDPWDDRAQYKTTDTFTPKRMVALDNAKFLDAVAPKGQGSNDAARKYMLAHHLVVIEVDGSLVRQYTDPKTGQRMQKSFESEPWMIAMLCEPGKECKVFLAIQGKLKEGGRG